MGDIKALSSLQHPLLKEWIRLRDSRKQRYQEKTVLVEGVKLVKELCLSHPSWVKALMFHEERAPIGENSAFIRYSLSEAMVRKLSDLESPEGYFALISMPVYPLDILKGKQHLIALDGVSDPGNVGTIIRSALALGWEGVFFLNGACDPYNSKAIRSAKGASFSIPLLNSTWEELSLFIKLNPMAVYVADLEGLDLNEAPKKKSSLLILSNEASGPSEEALKLGHALSICMTGNVESLNVAIAGAIMMYELGPQKKW